jgi:putative endonuclease
MASYALGVRAEALAAVFLQQQGYQILRQNFRARRGEIDLIAMEDRTLCFVEVRYRRQGRFGHPSDTIGGIKQRRIARTAGVFLATAWTGPICACRFDVVTLLGDDAAPEIVLLRNAFEAPAGSY